MKVAPEVLHVQRTGRVYQVTAVVGFGARMQQLLCAQRYRGEMKADDLGSFVMDKLLRLKEVPSVASEELEQNFAPVTMGNIKAEQENAKNDKVKFIIFHLAPRRRAQPCETRHGYSNDVHVVRIHHTERDQGKWKQIYGVESAPAVVVLKSESNEVIVKPAFLARRA